MKAVLCLLAVAGGLRADAQTVTASALSYNDFSHFASTQIAPFDTTLGSLTSVDLKLSGHYEEAEHYIDDPTYDGPSYFATASITTTGTSSFFGPASNVQSTSMYVTDVWQVCHQVCNVIASVQFGGERTFSGTDLGQFENGAPVPLSARASSTFETTPGLLCCSEGYQLVFLPGTTWPPVEGYLSLDVSATYTYTPAAPAAVPEPRTGLCLTLALPIMLAASRWRRRRARFADGSTRNTNTASRAGVLKPGSLSAGAGSQLFRRQEPILLRRSLGTASGLPEFMSEGCNVIMPECGDAMSNRRRLIVLMTFRGVLQGLP